MSSTERMNNDRNPEHLFDLVGVEVVPILPPCDCVYSTGDSDLNNPAGNPEKPKLTRQEFVDETFELGTLNFYRTFKSLIEQPDKFVERVEGTQSVFYRESECTSSEEIAAKIKQFVTNTVEIDVLQRRIASPSLNAKLRDPAKFKAEKEEQLRLLLKARKQAYKTDFGFYRIINDKRMSNEEFDEIFDADVRNIWGMFGITGEDKKTYLDPARIKSYFDEMDGYVVRRETTR
jgi:hypothetical protein